MITKLFRNIIIGTLAVFMVVTINARGITQQDSLGKLFFKKGLNIEGQNLRLSIETTTVEIMGQNQVIMLSDIVQIMAKQGKDKCYGKNCAGSCAGVYLGLWLASGGTTVDEYGNETNIDPAQYMVGGAVWTGVSYGIGYLIDRLSDDWQVVYLNRG